MDATAGTWDWDEVKTHYPVGAKVEGTVVNVPPYGVWIDLGIGFQALMRIPDCGLGPGEKTADWFKTGQVITAKVFWHDDKLMQVLLTRRA